MESRTILAWIEDRTVFLAWTRTREGRETRTGVEEVVGGVVWTRTRSKEQQLRKSEDKDANQKEQPPSIH